MALLLRVARRPLAPLTTLCQPTRCALFQSLCAFSTAPILEGGSSVKKTNLSLAERLALLPPTLQAFHARRGHFIMNFGFKVPEDDDVDVHPHLPAFPEAARGLTLGTTLHWFLVADANRHKHAHVLHALDAIGFPVGVDWEQYVWDHQRLPALRVYRELHGDLLVPKSFVVPTGDVRWPKETWGFQLGQFTLNMKHRDHRSLRRQHLEDLDQLNTSWELNALTQAKRLALLVDTMTIFHAKYGHFIMPFGFIVPKDEDVDLETRRRVGNHDEETWPLAARGQMLGLTLRYLLTHESIRKKHQDVVQGLADMGVPVDVDWQQYVFERQKLAAFRVYQALHGDCLVPQSFVVPTGDTTWPKETWGFSLGQYRHDMRSGHHRSLTQIQRHALAELGVLGQLNDLPIAERLALLAPTLQAFHARHGHFIMHAHYVVPVEDDLNVHPHLPRYPEAARGLRIGTSLYRLLVRDQSRQKFSHVLQELKEIGFPVDVDWKDYVFQRRLAALRVYRELHGDCRVPMSFVVPTADARWPKETWGSRLGNYAYNLRDRDYQLLTQDQLGQLNELGFYWGRHGKRHSKKNATKIAD